MRHRWIKRRLPRVCWFSRSVTLSRVHPLIVAEGDAESEILFYSFVRLLKRLWPQVMQRVNQIRAAKRPKTG